ncbi:MAG TPA: hypothetical protein VKH15_17245 [Candidatus Acidoferrum sp.]|nr:hypothetical protein [Candidatus Acidoferrum sp.]
MKRSTHKGALAAREAHSALLELREMVESAAKRVHAAEFEAARMAIGGKGEVSSETPLESAAESLRSPSFEAAVAQARDKVEVALAFTKAAGH